MHVIIESPAARHEREFVAAARRSRSLHGSWIKAPDTPEAFRDYVRTSRDARHVCYIIRERATTELVGVVNINEIVRGAFQSGYLGYYAFLPVPGKGLMTEGLALVVSRAFRHHRLHRLEANIQGTNEPSVRLVKRLGFRLEGHSRRYLKIGGRWRDHERWAILAEDWRARKESA